MFLLLIIPILISGFYVCNHNLYYFYRLHRYEGQYLYLKSAMLGFTCLIAASATALLLNSYVPEEIFSIPVDITEFINQLINRAVNNASQDNKELAWIILLAILTPVFAWLWVQLSLLHIKWRAKGDLEKSKIMLMSSILSDSPLDKTLMDSYIYEIPLMITLNDRKIYVGIVSSLGEPNESEGMDQEISIIPIMSGYRDKNDFHVNFTTKYEIIGKDLNIVLRQEIINSATQFDFNVFDEFSKHQKLKEKEKTIKIPKDSKYFFWKS